MLNDSVKLNKKDIHNKKIFITIVRNKILVKFTFKYIYVFYIFMYSFIYDSLCNSNCLLQEYFSLLYCYLLVSIIFRYCYTC